MTSETARDLAESIITEARTPAWNDVHLHNLRVFLSNGDGVSCVQAIQAWMERLSQIGAAMLQGLPADDQWLVRAWIQFRFLENL